MGVPTVSKQRTEHSAAHHHHHTPCCLGACQHTGAHCMHCICAACIATCMHYICAACIATCMHCICAACIATCMHYICAARVATCMHYICAARVATYMQHAWLPQCPASCSPAGWGDSQRALLPCPCCGSWRAPCSPAAGRQAGRQGPQSAARHVMSWPLAGDGGGTTLV